MIEFLIDMVEELRSQKASELKEIVREIRNKDLENIKENVKKTVESLEDNDFIVHHVNRKEFYEEFNELVEGFVVKSKTNLGRELGIEKIINLLETDCGDFIVQFLGEESSFPILPAAHLSEDEILSKFREKGVNVKDVIHLKNWIKDEIKKKLMKADVGITGVNFISSSGSLFFLENEGNLILTSMLPKKHVVIGSWEKITKDDMAAFTLCKAQAYFALGNEKTSYLHVLSSPSSTSDIGGKKIIGMYGPEEVHVFLIKREEILNSEFKEILKCINCGNCSNFCPAFPIGINRKGIIGLIYEFFYQDRERVLKEIYKCSLCGICSEVCPVGIDHKKLIRRIREILNREGFNTEENKLMIKRMMEYGNPIGKVVEGEKVDLFCC